MVERGAGGRAGGCTGAARRWRSSVAGAVAVVSVVLGWPWVPGASGQTPVTSSLGAGGFLTPGQLLRSQNADVLAMQTDGNLVLYAGGRARWQSGSAGNPGAQLAMQPDGNAVVYSVSGRALWQSGTAGFPGAQLVLQADSNAVVYTSTGRAVWQSGTAGVAAGPAQPPGLPITATDPELAPGTALAPGEDLQDTTGRYVLAMQQDGNLVLYARNARALWSSGTAGRPGARLDMGTDGNLVVSVDSVRLWQSTTSGFPGSRTVLQTDGNLVTYSAGGRALWSSGTGGATTPAPTWASLLSGIGPLRTAAVSGDGSRIAFVTPQNGLVPGDADGLEDLFVRDLASGTTRLVSRTPAGAQTVVPADYRWLSLSDDGRLLGFVSESPELTATDEPGEDAFVADLSTGAVRRLTVDLPRRGDPFRVAVAPGGRVAVVTAANATFSYGLEAVTAPAVRSFGGAERVFVGGISLSADGRFLGGVTANSGALGDVRVVRLDLVTGGLASLAGPAATEHGGAISADGRRVTALTPDNDGRPRVLIWSPDSISSPVRVALDGTNAGAPVISPAGDTVTVRFVRSVWTTANPPRATVVLSRSGGVRWSVESQPSADVALLRTASGVAVVDKGDPGGPSGWAVRSLGPL